MAADVKAPLFIMGSSGCFDSTAVARQSLQKQVVSLHA
jgi:hypothetical protein